MGFSNACGEGGIRTRVTREGPKVFETWPFNRSGTSPALDRELDSQLRGLYCTVLHRF